MQIKILENAAAGSACLVRGFSGIKSGGSRMSAIGISKEIETAGQLEELRQEVRIAAEELLSAANMKPGQILVVGCSSSEIASHKIGSYSSAEIGKAVFEELYAVTKSQGLYLAAQCCEHLNRALIVEEEAAEKYGTGDGKRRAAAKSRRFLCNGSLCGI